MSDAFPPMLRGLDIGSGKQRKQRWLMRYQAAEYLGASRRGPQHDHGAKRVAGDMRWRQIEVLEQSS